MATIKSVHAREILDSRGNPTIEVDVQLNDGAWGRAAIPSGASTGKFEAVELRDFDKNRFLGRGVTTAVLNVNTKIAEALIDTSVDDQSLVDRALIELDGTENKATLGANAILGVSLAVARAAASSANKPFFEFLKPQEKYELPVPQMNILNGGAHADNNVDIQEFMVVPVKGPRFSDALRAGVETFHALKKVLKEKRLGTGVGDEGGFAPNLDSNEAVFELLLQAIETAGYKPGEDIFIALDVAANEILKDGSYHIGETTYSAKTLVDWYESLINKYPIISIEDGLGEEDWDGWKILTEQLGKR
ncbi:phosphopyruvate hydratase, partial [Bdellovibrionota bacterium]